MVAIPTNHAMGHAAGSISAVRCDTLIFTGHAFTRMFARAISPDEVRAVVDRGETIAEYPDDTPYPSALLLATVGGRAFTSWSGVTLRPNSAT